MTDDAAAAIVRAAFDLGVRTFDTAPLYGLGLAEERLGVALSGVRRDTYQLSTKVGRLLTPDPDAGSESWAGFHVRSGLRPRWDLTPSGIRRCLEGSLTRLGVDHVDIAFLHDPDLSGDPDAVATGLRALEDLRDEGLTRRLGVATKDVPTLMRALDLGSAEVVMTPGRLTVLNQDAMPVAHRAAEAQVAVWNAAPFHGGALAGVPPPDQGYGSLSEPEARTLAQVSDALGRRGIELPVAALQCAARMPGVERVVVGADTPGQVSEAVTALDATADVDWEEFLLRVGTDRLTQAGNVRRRSR